MLLPAMTYEEIYQAISKEMPEVFGHYQKIVKSKVDRALKTATNFPKRITINWEHPKSRNTYTYYIQSNRRAQWSNPFMTVFCSRDVKKGKELFIVVPNPMRKELLLQVFTKHFYDRYGERFLNDTTDYYKSVAQFVIRNTDAESMGEECVSENELKIDIPGYKHESMLTIDGLCEGLRNEQGNIIIYRTFVSFDLLFKKQYERVWARYLYCVCKWAMINSPKDRFTLNSIYEEGSARIHQIANDTIMPEEEKRQQIYKEYEQTYQKLIKYIKI